MVWDLRGALLKKEEFESARLTHFEFRQRARAMRLLAVRIGGDSDQMALRIADKPDEGILADLAAEFGCDPQTLVANYLECWVEARVQLIEEIGDPTPHRLG
ncbi:MAG: hypothetical protein J7485_01920 [Sphingobium sp.]|nr:hypothetical protein [Sphingobium sp.]